MVQAVLVTTIWSIHYCFWSSQNEANHQPYPETLPFLLLHYRPGFKSEAVFLLSRLISFPSPLPADLFTRGIHGRWHVLMGSIASVMLLTQREQRGDVYVYTVSVWQRERTGPPLCAERDSVLLTRLPSNYDVTGAHDKEQHHDRLRERGGEIATDTMSRWLDKHQFWACVLSMCLSAFTANRDSFLVFIYRITVHEP